MSSRDDIEYQRSGIADRLRRGREYVGLSQDEVAKALNIPRPAVSNIESGARRVEAAELDALARLYGLSANYILTGEEGLGGGGAAGGEQVAFLARALKGLSPDDIAEVARFAAFLKRAPSPTRPQVKQKKK